MNSKYFYGKMKMYKPDPTSDIVYSPQEMETAMSAAMEDAFDDAIPPALRTAVAEEALRDEKEKPWILEMTNRYSTAITAALLLAAILLALGVVISTNGFRWLYELKTVDSAPLGEIGVVLAPLLALALAIERFIETLFDYFEGEIRNVARIADISKAGIEELEENLNTAWVAYNNAATLSVEALNAAEAKLTGISEIFLNLPRNPIYVAYKRRMSIIFGFMLGFVVAIFTDQGLFEYLQIPVPRIMDMFVTGAVLGAGAGPMHSIVGALDGLQASLRAIGSRPSTNEILNEVRRMTA